MSNTTKKPTGMLVLVVALAVILIALVILALNFHLVDFQLYARNSTQLDLTQKSITTQHYDKLHTALPECDIHWNVPFQGGTLDSEATVVTVTTLSDEDVEILTYLPKLKTVHAENCMDYAQLLTLRQTLPNVQVDYRFRFSGESYDPDTTTIFATSATEEEILSLQYLPTLETVVACGNDAQTDFSQLQNYCLNSGLEFYVQAGGQLISCDATDLTVEGIAENEVYLLQYLKDWQKLHLVKPEASAQTVLDLREQYPEADITWEVEIAGERYDDTTAEVDLSTTVLENLTPVETAMAYLPEAEILILGLCGIDNPDWGNSKMDALAESPIENEDVAAFRDRVQEQYKVVWTVRLGPHIALRTDADNFMPNHFGVGRLPDDYAYNLRYCIDMVCLDLGHMTLSQIDFVEYMPKLKYLILAWTNVQYIEPIRSCKNLIFLELDNSAIRDLAPLVDCTALEDLNIGNAWPDTSALLEMPWLKNVYMIFGSRSDAWKISQALPDTRVVTSGNATVGGGWRRMQNYYDMRDMLHAPYMN